MIAVGSDDVRLLPLTGWRCACRCVEEDRVTALRGVGLENVGLVPQGALCAKKAAPIAMAPAAPGWPCSVAPLGAKLVIVAICPPKLSTTPSLMRPGAAVPFASPTT